MKLLRSEWLTSAAVAGSAVLPLAAGFFTLRLFGKAFSIDAFGFLASLQAFASLVILVSDVNIGVAFIRLFPGWNPHDQRVAANAVRRATFGSASIFVLLSIFFGRVGTSLFGSAASRWSLPAATISGVALLHLQQCINILSAKRKTAAIVSIAVVQSAFTTLVALAVIRGFHPSRPTECLMIANGVSVGLGAELCFRVFTERAQVSVSATRAEARRLIHELFRNGGAITFAAIMGSGALLAQPLILRSVAGYEAAASLRIATGVAGVIGAIVTAVLMRVWAPIVSGISDDDVFAFTLDRASKSLRVVVPVALVLIVGAPVIVGLFVKVSATAVATLRIRLVVEVVRSFGLWFGYSVMISHRLRSYIRLETLGFIAIMAFGSLGSIQGGAVGSVVGLGVASVLYSGGAVWSLRHR